MKTRPSFLPREDNIEFRCIRPTGSIIAWSPFAWVSGIKDTGRARRQIPSQRTILRVDYDEDEALLPPILWS